MENGEWKMEHPGDCQPKFYYVGWVGFSLVNEIVSCNLHQTIIECWLLSENRFLKAAQAAFLVSQTIEQQQGVFLT